MKRNLVLVVALLAVVAVTAGCVAGPWHCTNVVWDWSADVYADNTYLGTMNYILIAPIGMALGELCDVVAVNTYYWWWDDLWDGTGTTYNHVSAPNGRTND